MYKKLLLSLFFLVSIKSLVAQREAAVWYFGNNAGLDFNSGTPIALEDGKLDTGEGCASISDKNGNLLFYTDGVTVWDKAHRVMPNGIDLLGHYSSTQSAIIVPKPGSKTQYYIFTVDEPNPKFTPNEGLNYSIVDLTLNNGYGDIIEESKNTHLITYDVNDEYETRYKCSEKITAVQHEDGISFWVITHFLSNFYAFKIDTSGVIETPVVTNTDLNVPLSGYLKSAIGALKLSPNGEKLAIAHSQTEFIETNNDPKIRHRESGKVLLYDFNASTGRVSNEKTILGGAMPYGIEFSPKASKLYVTVTNNDDRGETYGSSMFQYDLSAADIAKSKVEIYKGSNVAGALQLAIDKKIYRAGFSLDQSSHTLSVINKPELKGLACDFKVNSVNLKGKWSQLGLPPFVQSLFLFSFEYQNICLGETTEFNIISEDPFDHVLWNFGDGNTSTDISPQHTYKQPGNYIVSLTRYDILGNPTEPAIKEITIYDQPFVPTTPIDFFQCESSSVPDGIETFNLHQIDDFFEQKDIDQIINVYYYPDLTSAEQDSLNINPLPYTYTNTLPEESLTAKVLNPLSGCYSYANIRLKVKQPEVINGEELIGCDNGDGTGSFNLEVQNQYLRSNYNLPESSIIRYYTNRNNAKIGTDNNLDMLYTSSPKIIFVRIDNENICYGIGEFNLKIEEKFELEENEELIICTNSSSPLVLDSGIAIDQQSNFSFQWSTGENTPSIEVLNPGSYVVYVTSYLGCTEEREFFVTPSNIATINNVKVKDGMQNYDIIISVSGEGNYEFSLEENGPYQDSNLFENIQSGVVTVYVHDKNDCGIQSEMVSVVGYPKYFSPNGDNINDYWQLDGMAENLNLQSFIYIYDRYGSLLASIDPKSQGWDGNYQGKALPASDYWFRVVLQDGRELKSHFALKR